MNNFWQELIALGIVAAAVGYLGRTVYRMLFGAKSACGGCGTCAADKEAPPLVSLDLTGNTPAAKSKPTS